MPEIVNALWIHGELASLELLTIQSFIHHGFQFQLWTYEPETINAPATCIIKNAVEILPFEAVFFYQNTNKHGHGKGSYAGFSDVFRYKLLYENGGIWTDMDITCLKPFTIHEEYFFRFHHKSGAVGNFMKCPQHSELMKWCYEEASAKVNEENKNWMLPIEILNNGIQRYKLENYIQVISNNDSFPEVSSLLLSYKKINPDWKIIHWMNEEFRRMNISKSFFIKHSTLDYLLNQYAIPHAIYRGCDTIRQHIILSRFFYLLKNIGSTLRWYVSPD